MTTEMNTIYKTAKCGCNIEINAVYNEVEGFVEVYDVYIVKACDDHRPGNSPEYELENDELEDDCEDDPRRNGAIKPVELGEEEFVVSADEYRRFMEWANEHKEELL